MLPRVLVHSCDGAKAAIEAYNYLLARWGGGEPEEQ
jgi:hypothetical protein